MLKRPALGQGASLGRLYDARKDDFVPLSLLKAAPPDGAIAATDIPSSDIKYTRSDSFKEKFHQLDVGPGLSASFLAGFFNVDGSGSYLNEKRDTNLAVHASLIYNVTTVNEVINFLAPGMEDCLALDVLESDLATHVVAEIAWGSRNVVTIKQSLSQRQSARKVSARLNAQISLLGSKLSGGGQGDKISGSQDLDNSFEVVMCADVMATDGCLPTDLSGAAHFLKSVPKYVANANGGKGKPLSYTLLPVAEVAARLKFQISRAFTLKQLSLDCSENFVRIFDEMAIVRRDLNDYRATLLEHREYISQAHIRTIGDRVVEARTAETQLKAKYAGALIDVRSGKSDESLLWKILEDFTKGETATRRLAETNSRPQKEKIALIQGLIAKGAMYIGFNGESFDLAMGSSPNLDIYVLYLSDEARRNSSVWQQNTSLIHQLLDDQTRQSQVIVKDCDALDEPLPKPRIALFRNAEEIIDDVLEDRKASSSKCGARYIKAHLDRSGAPKPPSRIPIKMPCPGPNCSISTSHEWICAKCNCPIEYGHVDEYIYCDCGRCDYRHWTFRCSNQRHGLDYHVFADARLKGILSALEPFEELNILILGRTGVGKSTWINAFVNYLMFPSLDDALNDNQKLQWIIPFAFRTYNLNAQDEFEDVKIKVGFEDPRSPNGGSDATKVGVDEHDGTAGGSATQKTAVHRVQIGKMLIRLIDTPGIGDTRGASQDSKNMADILSVLRSYQNIHGILILLKPNDQRLDLMFKFCIQELLTHLHRDAAKNIAFGFTNTRGTNYRPGDTFDPLRELLQRFEDVEITLRKHNVYCFDSESFRYLAARKQQNQMLGELEENKASWNYSVKESRRLIDYFQSLPPHKVTSTVNLYETRHRIVRMTEPMAAIAETIRATIMVNKDEINDLSQSETKKKDLEKILRIEVKTLTAVRVSMPKTTCSDESCIERSSTGIEGLDGREILKTVYKSMCHSPCYLNNVQLDNIGDRGLRGCWAMNGTEYCRICGHPWNSHLHINWEIQHGTKEINDPEVEAALRLNADFRTKKQAAISGKKRLIADLESELKKIGDAAAQFSIFLKRNAIMPYNDATIDYLERCMEEEKGKVAVGGSRDKLDSLTQYRRQYEQQVAILVEYMKKGEDHMLLNQAGIEILLQELHDLKHYGQTLRDMGRVIHSSQTVVHREKPFVMRARSHWTGGEEEPEYATVSRSTTAAKMAEESARARGRTKSWKERLWQAWR
ncbi:hypothetical protein B0H63DRAFT_489620 [Podospora didyma]|uniref:G domain-containing protein n=1 Tax=Podospora didyma TaxID=330526 RepID=A0AAE0N349_9PEZI|nr:hypothetical protein B0H63DRAFT_489620 [Podospora didyma]